MKPFVGKITADVFEVRFAFSGKVAAVFKTAGETVNKGEVIAALDRQPYQVELDIQLADYERARAEFEIFNLKNSDAGDVTKFLKQERQAALNAAVKQVELAKMKLDQVNLIAPCDGVILESENLLPGLNVTPANAAVKVQNVKALTFSSTIGQKELHLVQDGRKIRVKFEGIKESLEVTTEKIYHGENGKFTVVANIPLSTGLLPGMVGEANII